LTVLLRAIYIPIALVILMTQIQTPLSYSYYVGSNLMDLDYSFAKSLKL